MANTNKSNRANGTTRQTTSLRRDASGRFTSATTKTRSRTSSANSPSQNLKRDASGRFVSAKSAPTKRKTVTPRNSKRSSSFIQSMSINGSTINVVMKRNPKITYTYNANATGLKAAREALSSGGSLGTVYNKHLKGRELSRTIYR